RAIDWAVDREPSEGGAFLAVNAGRDDWNWQVRDLADAVARIVPGTEVSVRPDAPPDKRSYRVSFARFRDLAPQHQPRLDLEEAIGDLDAGLGRMGFAAPDCRESELMRLNVLQRLRAEGELTDALAWRGAPLVTHARP